MCSYVEADCVTPGVACCACRAYNGLQRRECRVCGKPVHDVEVPPEITRCSCGFGLRGGDHQRTLSGKDVRGKCPSCAAPWPAAPTTAAALGKEVPGVH